MKRIQVNHNIGNELDFGYGFYLTPKEQQAKDFIQDLLAYTGGESVLQGLPFLVKDNPEDKVAVVVEFEFTPLDWFYDDHINTMVLNSYDDEFADFVFFNRTENIYGEHQHDYKAIFGVMSDSKPNIVLSRFKNGEIGKDEVIESFKKTTSNKQLSIHTQDFCDILVPSKAYIIETGEELDVNEYSYGKKQVDVER
ncbi:DUF3990 domain-containing protein [Pontibacillus salipaludis]|nr:DUF3990 domain-containing protein [Pontibacillus salipaludis]